MLETDIAVVGGGLAGSTAAAMLGRAGHGVVLVDPHPVYPPDFRCEKLDGPQVAILRKTRLADAVLAAATHDGEVGGGSWVARMGRLVEKRPGDQHGILYDTLVNTIRGEIPHTATIMTAKVIDVVTSSDRQVVSTSAGEDISARIVVLANGLNVGLQHKLGLSRQVTSPCHSITVGFDLKQSGRQAFAFSSLTYYAEHVADRMAYLTLFPIGGTMRANLMTYRDMQDPWLRTLRHQPADALDEIMPGLRNITGAFDVGGPVKIRPADLYVTEGYRQPGVVVVGDAFATSCPAAGTGTGKVFTDVERLCNVHMPAWLATNGMGAEKIARFYDDPVKQASDTHSSNKAYHLRALSTEPGLPWRIRRGARFGAGVLRQVRGRLSGMRPQETAAAATSG